MGVFLITPISNPDDIARAVKEHFPKEHLPIPRTGSILVSFNGTTRELSDDLGISKGEVGSAVVVPVTNYYGRAPVEIWEWMKTRLERE